MDPVIKPWIELWDYLDGNFWHVWQWASLQLSPGEVCWQPLPQVASVGWNLQHLGEMLDHYLAYAFCAQKPLNHQLPTMLAGSFDDGRFSDCQKTAAYHQRLRPAYRLFLERLTARDLERTLGPRGDRSWGWAIGHIAEHESYHLGKCTLLRSFLQQRRGR